CSSAQVPVFVARNRIIDQRPHRGPSEVCSWPGGHGMRIGFIGLGNMGGPMALNLIKAGHTLVVHDIRQQAAAPHLEPGAKSASTPRDAAHGAELVLTSLPGPKEVEAVALGSDGVIHGAVPGTVYADLST